MAHRAEPLEEYLHARHHVGMGIQRAAREADIRGSRFVEAAHEFPPAADHAHGESAGDRLAVSHHVGAHAEVFLRSARGEPKADEDLVEDERMPRSAHLAQPGEPCGVLARSARAPAAVDERAIGRRGAVRVERLHRVYQHAGEDVAAARARAASLRPCPSACVVRLGSGLPTLGCTSSHHPW